MREVLEFDQAIAVGATYAAKNQNTLLVVTADHETGGMEITKGNLSKDGTHENHGDVTEYMTLSDLRLLSKSKSSFEKLGKNVEKADNVTAIEKIVEDSTGIDITPKEALLIKENNPVSNVMDKPGNIISTAIADELSIQWSTAHHGAEPLMLFAMGPYSEKFKGFLDNTDVAKLISSAFKIGD
jgi:alkaline phosphatase